VVGTGHSAATALPAETRRFRLFADRTDQLTAPGGEKRRLARIKAHLPL
jgi:hypothetical protein